MKGKKNIFERNGFVSFTSSVLAIVCGLLFGLVILILTNPSQAFSSFYIQMASDFYGNIPAICIIDKILKRTH